MKSSEVAKLAGVSVRTLRHYHAIGLLPEPPRGQNGCRDYRAEDLVCLLRIKRLPSLGFSLSRIGEVLDEMDANLTEAAGLHADEALDELDRELALQIERLQEQRRTIALLKDEQIDLDLPVRFGRVKKQFENLSQRSSITNSDREALLVAGYLFTEEDADELERVLEALLDSESHDQLHKVQALFEELPASASCNEINSAVEVAMEFIGPFVDRFDSGNWEKEYNSAANNLMREITDKELNNAQRLATDRLEEALTARILGRVKDLSTPSPHALDPDVTS